MDSVHTLSISPPTPTENETNVIVASTPSDLPVLERRAVTVKHRVQCKQDQVISWLQDFYTEPGNLEKLLPILQGSSAISLRLIDYFVTNYSKKFNTSYMLNNRHFLVYFNYKRELNAYSKRLFDPFCRRERIMFQARGIEPFVTTVGQLNFFRWFIEKNIYEHVSEHREEIEKDMNSTLKQHYSRSNTTVTSTVSTKRTEATAATETIDETSEAKEHLADESLSNASSSRKKRCELTQSAMKKVNVHECDVVVHFS
jgi:hypothetical protein